MDIKLKTNVANSVKCYACGKKKMRTRLGYDIRNLKSYCLDFNDCMHPNHPKVELVPQEKITLENTLNEYHEGEAKTAIGRWISKTASFRPTVSQSYFLALVAQEFGLLSINQVLQFIIEEYMKEHPELYEKILKDDMIAESLAAYGGRQYQPKKLPPKPEAPEQPKRTIGGDIFTI